MVKLPSACVSMSLIQEAIFFFFIVFIESSTDQTNAGNVTNYSEQSKLMNKNYILVYILSPLFQKCFYLDNTLQYNTKTNIIIVGTLYRFRHMYISIQMSIHTFPEMYLTSRLRVVD